MGGPAMRPIALLARQVVCTRRLITGGGGDAIRTTEQFRYLQVVIAGNGLDDGIFGLSFSQKRQTWNVFSLSILVSNASILLVILHWLAALLALHRHFYDVSKDSRLVGIGIISNTPGFRLLPLILLPRLRNALAAFFTVWCYFEGDQMPLAEAWFVIYPGIAEVMLFVSSSINLIAKLTRRRVSDVLFGPTLIFFCGLHLLRQPIAQSSLIGFDGRIPAAISSGEYDKLTLLDLFTTNAALRLNGNMAMLFWTKMAVLGLNVVPLLFSRSTSVSHSTNRRREMNPAERVLAIRPLVNAGLGMSTQVFPDDLGAYDVVRHGYILYGDLVVMSITDWIFVLVFSLLGLVSSQFAVRVLVLPITTSISTTNSGDIVQQASWCRTGERMRYISVHDPLIKSSWPWEISATQIH